MTAVLPGILERSFDDIAQKLERLQGACEQAQLDITDGRFVPEETWNDPARIGELDYGIALDVHLMVEQPEKVIEQWNHPFIFRCTFHYEAAYDVRRTARMIKKMKKEAGLALKCETPLEVIDDFIEEIDLVLLMAVDPGAQGRQFDEGVVKRVAQLRAAYPDVPIGVDGGVSDRTARRLWDAGASMLVSGTYMFSQSNIKKALAVLQK